MSCDGIIAGHSGKLIVHKNHVLSRSIQTNPIWSHESNVLRPSLLTLLFSLFFLNDRLLCF